MGYYINNFININGVLLEKLFKVESILLEKIAGKSQLKQKVESNFLS